MGLIGELTGAAGSVFSGGISNSVDHFIGGNSDKGLVSAKRRSVRESFQARRLVFGRYLVKPSLVYVNASGQDNYLLRLNFVVACQHSDRILSVNFDDRKVLSEGVVALDGMSQELGIYDADYTDAIFTHFAYLGDPSWLGFQSDMDGPWSSGHHLTGMTAMTLQLAYDSSLFANGIPSITVELNGRLVHDPRDESEGFSTNFALCLLSFLTNELGESLDSVDLADFQNKANVCDQLVDTVSGQTEKRFTIGGELELDQNNLDNLQRILDSAGAHIVQVQGKWRLWLPVYESPVLSLDESDLAGNLSFYSKAGKQDRINVVKGSYISPDHDWERVECPVIRSQDYIENDGEILEQVYDYDLVTSGYQVQRLNKIKMERSRYGIVLQAPFKMKALRLAAGDRVSLSISYLGWSSKVFLVTNTRISITNGVTLTLREDGANIYSWGIGDAIEISTPVALNLPDHKNVPVPDSVSVSEELYKTTSARDVKTRIYINWTSSVAIDYQYDVEIKKQIDSEFTPVAVRYRGSKIKLDDIEPDDYHVRVRTINDVGFASDWVQISTTVHGKLLPPPDLETLFVDGGVLVWTYPDAPADLDGFLVRMHDGDRQSWGDAVPLHKGLVSASRLTLPASSGGTKTFLVKAVDTSGIESVNAVSATVGLGDPDVENVIVVDDMRDSAWSGALSGGTVVSGDIVASEVGGFYNSSGSSPFYNPDGASLFYDGEFERVEYEFTYTVAAIDAGSQLTIEPTVVNGTYQIEFIAPSASGGSYVPLAGYIPAAEEGVYNFRVSLPSQFGSTAPRLTNLFLRLDVPDVEETIENVLIGASTTRLPLSKSYRGIRMVQFSLQDDGSGAAFVRAIDKDHLLGPRVQVFNSNGVAVQATIDARIRGY